MSDDDPAKRATLEADWATSDDDRCEALWQEGSTEFGNRCALKREHEGAHYYGIPPYLWKAP